MISPFGPTGASCLIPPPNLLPIPALDGGRLLFLLIEAVRGKPVPKEKEAIVHIAGIIFLFIFMIFILFSDIIKIFQ